MSAEALPVPRLDSLAAFGAALPGDLTTCTITFGSYADVAGTPLATLVGRLYPLDPHNGRRVRLVNTTTGHVLLPSDIPITITAGVGSIGPIPHTDNASLAPAGFAYRVEWDLPSSKPSPGNKTFLLPASAGDSVDFDLLSLPDDIPARDTSDDAIAALLTDPTSATYAAVVALIAARTGFGRGA